MHIENHSVLEWAPVRNHTWKTYKVLSNCQFSYTWVQNVIHYKGCVRLLWLNVINVHCQDMAMIDSCCVIDHWYNGTMAFQLQRWLKPLLQPGQYPNGETALTLCSPLVGKCEMIWCHAVRSEEQILHCSIPLHYRTTSLSLKILPFDWLRGQMYRRARWS